MESIFSPHDLAWLDDIMPAKNRTEKETRTQKQEQDASDSEDVSMIAFVGQGRLWQGVRWAGNAPSPSPPTIYPLGNSKEQGNVACLWGVGQAGTTCLRQIPNAARNSSPLSFSVWIRDPSVSRAQLDVMGGSHIHCTHICTIWCISGPLAVGGTWDHLSCSHAHPS